MKKFDKNEIEDILAILEKSSVTDRCWSKPKKIFCFSGVTFLLSLIVLNFWLKNPNSFFIILLAILGCSSLFSFLEGIFVYKNPIVRFKRKYGKYFTEDENNFLFKNFIIPLYQTWFGSKIKELEEDLDKEGFDGPMKREAFFQRVEFFLENEVPEELRKEKEKIEKLQEEKRMEDKKTEARFKKYMDQYATGLETEKE